MPIYNTSDASQSDVNFDFRARLQPKNIDAYNEIFGDRSLVEKNILFPLWSTRGVLFPYTPKVNVGTKVQYTAHNYTHTNTTFNSYEYTAPEPITIDALFTASTSDEAMYMLSTIHFFKTVSKMYFGVQTYDLSGTPPPVLVFNYLGTYQFKDIPVVVTNFSYTLPNDVDYVPVNTAGKMVYSKNIGVNLPLSQSNGYTYVPTKLEMSITLDNQTIPERVRTDFNLDLFRTGKLMGGNGGYL